MLGDSCLYVSALFRDVAHISTCDEGCLALADLLGWKVGYTISITIYSIAKSVHLQEIVLGVRGMTIIVDIVKKQVYTLNIRKEGKPQVL